MPRPLRLRQSCAALADKFTGAFKLRKQPATPTKHLPPVPGLKLLYLTAWKTSIFSRTMGYNIGLVLVDFDAPTASTRAEGFLCTKMHAMTMVSETRDKDMAGAVYLGQVPKDVDIKKIRSAIPQGADLGISHKLDRFINMLWEQKLVYRYMDAEDVAEDIAPMLKLTCDTVSLAKDDEGWPTGLFEDHWQFLASPLPIFDLNREKFTDQAFLHIPGLNAA